VNISRPNTLTEDGLLSQIKRSDIEALLPPLKKLHDLAETRPPVDRRRWEKAYGQARAEMKLDNERPNVKAWAQAEKKYRQMDANYAKALSQRQENIGQIIKEIEPILRSRSAEALLRYDRQHGGNLRIIVRQIVDHTDRNEWYFTAKTICDAILFLLQVKGKLPLWYDKPTETKPTEPTGDKTGGDKVDLAKVPISKLIKQGESHTLEFKEIAECNTQQNRKNNDVLFPSLKAIAGFSNAKGGTLLIGVDDSGKITGIDQYLNTMKRGNNDTFEQQIRNCLKDRFSPQPIGKVNMSFGKFTEGTICRVDVHASQEIVHLDNKVYVREGNTTQLLEGQSLSNWTKQR